MAAMRLRGYCSGYSVTFIAANLELLRVVRCRFRFEISLVNQLICDFLKEVPLGASKILYPRTRFRTTISFL